MNRQHIVNTTQETLTGLKQYYTNRTEVAGAFEQLQQLQSWVDQAQSTATNNISTRLARDLFNLLIQNVLHPIDTALDLALHQLLSQAFSHTEILTLIEQMTEAHRAVFLSRYFPTEAYTKRKALPAGTHTTPRPYLFFNAASQFLDLNFLPSRDLVKLKNTNRQFYFRAIAVLFNRQDDDAVTAQNQLMTQWLLNSSNLLSLKTRLLHFCSESFWTNCFSHIATDTLRPALHRSHARQLMQAFGLLSRDAQARLKHLRDNIMCQIQPIEPRMLTTCEFYISVAPHLSHTQLSDLISLIELWIEDSACFSQHSTISDMVTTVSPHLNDAQRIRIIAAFCNFYISYQASAIIKQSPDLYACIGLLMSQLNTYSTITLMTHSTEQWKILQMAGLASHLTIIPHSIMKQLASINQQTTDRPADHEIRNKHNQSSFAYITLLTSLTDIPEFIIDELQQCITSFIFDYSAVMAWLKPSAHKISNNQFIDLYSAWLQHRDSEAHTDLFKNILEFIAGSFAAEKLNAIKTQCEDQLAALTVSPHTEDTQQDISPDAINKLLTRCKNSAYQHYEGVNELEKISHRLTPAQVELIHQHALSWLSEPGSEQNPNQQKNAKRVLRAIAAQMIRLPDATLAQLSHREFNHHAFEHQHRNHAILKHWGAYIAILNPYKKHSHFSRNTLANAIQCFIAALKTHASKTVRKNTLEALQVAAPLINTVPIDLFTVLIDCISDQRSRHIAPTALKVIKTLVSKSGAITVPDELLPALFIRINQADTNQADNAITSLHALIPKLPSPQLEKTLKLINEHQQPKPEYAILRYLVTEQLLMRPAMAETAPKLTK